MNNAQMSARVGLFFLMGVALIWVVFSSLSKGKITRDNGYVLTATFTNLKELKTGDEVRMAGVKIGIVKETRLVGRRAQAVLLIDDRQKVPLDSSATIAMAGLLGNNYVAVDLGTDSAGYHQAGSSMKSVDTPDLNTLVNEMGEIGRKIDTALSKFNGALTGEGTKDGGLLGKMEKLVDENREKIGSITSNLDDITGKVRRGEGTVGKLINDSKLHDDLLASVQEIKAAAADARSFVSSAQAIADQVKSGQGTLGVLVYDKESGENMKATVKNVRQISDKLAKGEGTIGKLLNDEQLYLQAESSMRKLDRALDGMADQGPITAVGTLGRSLF